MDKNSKKIDTQDMLATLFFHYPIKNDCYYGISKLVVS